MKKTKLWKKKAAKPEYSSKGQVVTEYVIFMVLCMLLTLVLFALFRGFSSENYSIIDMLVMDYP